VHVVAIDDQPDPAVGIGERRAHRARLARGHGRHRVEQMRETAQAGREGGLQLFVRGVRVARGDDDTGIGERADDRGRRAFGRERHERDPAVRRRQQFHGVRVEGAQLGAVVHATAFVAEEWPFDVDAKHAGNPPGDRVANRIDRARDHREVVADQRGQKSRGAIPAVRGTDGRDAVDVGAVVEQHAAATIHLRVDETGHEQLAVEIEDAIGTDDLARAHDRFDAPVTNQQRAAVFDARIGQDLAILEREQHQTVSVTLWRCGGWSGSRPRASASAFAMP
jgi:hypothetical protein